VIAPLIVRPSGFFSLAGRRFSAWPISATLPQLAHAAPSKRLTKMLERNKIFLRQSLENKPRKRGYV